MNHKDDKRSVGDIYAVITNLLTRSQFNARRASTVGKEYGLFLRRNDSSNHFQKFIEFGLNIRKIIETVINYDECIFKNMKIYLSLNFYGMN